MDKLEVIFLLIRLIIRFNVDLLGKIIVLIYIYIYIYIMHILFYRTEIYIYFESVLILTNDVIINLYLTYLLYYYKIINDIIYITFKLTNIILK